MAKFSVIVPIHNQSQYLDRMIKSFDVQSFKDFEVIFIDDGNDDSGQKINALPFQFTYIKVEDKGMRLAYKINRGIERATGEYITLIMGDSFPETNYFEILNEWATDEKVICGVRVNVEGDRFIEIEHRVRKEYIPKSPVLLSHDPFYMATGNGLSIPMSALKEIGLFDEKITGYGGEDNEMLARLYFRGYLIWSVPQLILYHNWHKSNYKPNIKSNDVYVNRKIYEYEGKTRGR